MPERALRHLDVEAVLAIHEEVLAAHGGLGGLRDRALLESAVAAPQASFGGKPLIRDPIEVAAAYLFYLCRNHPFVDGNKRTALAAALVFLDANGLLPDPGAPARKVDDWESLVLDVASAKLGRDQASRKLQALLKR
ncbi:MAG TPA: type II toxin-antitoxin system death-on-curing family toxin [Burkholderiales bacterium]|nr:type II toxin-antitoxin system death-on-curing family toxin [Burkholderiales bacterium]